LIAPVRGKDAKFEQEAFAVFAGVDNRQGETDILTVPAEKEIAGTVSGAVV